MVDLALKTLLHDKTRFAITVSGVAFAVALIMVQVGLFLGLLDNASVTIDRMDAELWVTSKATPNVDFAHAFPETRVERVRSVPGVVRADNLIVAFMNVRLPSGAESLGLGNSQRVGGGGVRHTRRGVGAQHPASSRPGCDERGGAVSLRMALARTVNVGQPPAGASYQRPMWQG